MRDLSMRRTRFGKNAAVMARCLAITALILSHPANGLPRGPAPATIPMATSAALANSAPATQPMTPELAPDAALWPFRRLLIALILGPACSYLRLWNRFQRYWSLGVTTNRYAAVYIGIGAIMAWLSNVVGNQTATHHPWLAGHPLPIAAFGLTTAYFAPVMRVPWGNRRLGGDEPGSLPFPPSPNLVYAFLEAGVQDCIRKRMHKEVSAILQQYGSATIKLACQRTIEQERTVAPLADTKYTGAVKAIGLLPDNAEPGTDLKLKYETLTRLLSICEFRHLRFHLDEAAREEAQ